MTIAERIHNGWTAERLGLTSREYASRKTTLDRFLATWSGEDFDPAYRAWLRSQSESDRGQDSRKTRGARIRDTKKKPCNCGGGKVR